jgi:hypothetical protein
MDRIRAFLTPLSGLVDHRGSSSPPIPDAAPQGFQNEYPSAAKLSVDLHQHTAVSAAPSYFPSDVDRLRRRFRCGLSTHGGRGTRCTPAAGVVEAGATRIFTSAMSAFQIPYYVANYVFIVNAFFLS